MSRDSYWTIDPVLGLMRQDYMAGVAPIGATRPLHPHELEAQTDFPAIEQHTDAVAAAVALLLASQRKQFIALVAAELALHQQYGDAAALAAWWLTFVHSPGNIPGGTQLIRQFTYEYHQHLEEAANGSLDRVADEAERQGASVPDFVGLDEATQTRIMLVAQRLSTAPLQDVLRAGSDVIYRAPTADAVTQAMSSLSDDALTTTYARPAAHESFGLGRLVGLQSLPQATAYYASELLDKNTCDRCGDIDGTRYDTLSDATSDYPSGGYVHCRGGDRCRGMIVAKWSDDA